MSVTENAKGESELLLTLNNPVNQGAEMGMVARFKGQTTSRGPGLVALNIIEGAEGALVDISLEGSVDCTANFRPDLMGKRPTKKVSHCVMYDQSLKGDAMPLRNVPRANKDERVMNTRIDKDQLEEILFGCFETQQNWKLEHLRQHTKQPMEWLRQVVNGICVHIKKGKDKNTVQLKEEHGGPALE
eukprot:TRINITY_DN9980_c0_g1_i3.p1 TRINITY_DN9980_c0_g1~~TRINITY_DN9980_c0_g1_i3.p1  ORF type:complete len:187 (-),score=42.13 TRINITY_DN9980_c0_g1_i3:138-698(-)